MADVDIDPFGGTRREHGRTEEAMVKIFLFLRFLQSPQ